ncbi:amidohydrolase family protein [Pareuzebyella sediminis]|uniref:amidohydrolase family protein n=1 Tax=Pareuzebyella sediminis TaxID=2607998 RepID=UPI0011EC653D|nr:amidohydrolase family protein [Pareuzebyella sediminis]
MLKAIIFACIILMTSACSRPAHYDLVIRNVDLFDGHRGRGLVNLAINSDTIAAITSEEIRGDSLINGTGKYIIPGMVNAHVHVSNIDQLKEGFPFGILTLFNMHTGLEEREKEWKKISMDSTRYATLYGAGHAATVPGGHPTQFSPNMETINDSVSVEDWVDHRIAKGADYIKIIHTLHGWMGSPPTPTLRYEQIAKIIEYAHSKGYKVVVHATSLEDVISIAKFRPDGFVHMLDFKEDYPVPNNYYKELKKSGAFIVTTGGIALKPMDGAPPFVAEWVNENVLNAEQRAEIIKEYHENGILLVAGTDAQEGQMNFAEDYFLELELYQMAGLSNVEILKAATGNAAKAFGIPVGELKVGAKATFIVLDENPLRDLSNLHKATQIWKNGNTY